VGRAWGALSLRQRAGVAFVVWAIAFEILAVATAIPGGPTAALTVDDDSPIVGQTVHFDASASVGHDNGRGRIVSYRFDFGDGAGTADQVSPTASHAYPDVGARRATVVVRDERGNEGRASLTVNVQPRPPPTGPSPDLAPVAAATSPAEPSEGDVVSLSITIVNHGEAAAESATIDATDERPNGTTVAIGQTHLLAPLSPGASVVVYAPSFIAEGVGNHTLRIVVGNVTPSETYTQDNVKTIWMTVVPSTGPPPPTGGEFPLATTLYVLALAAAGVAAAVVAARLLRPPREPGPLEPPPAEPRDESPPPLRPP
jgi:PKD domain/CARDB